MTTSSTTGAWADALAALHLLPLPHSTYVPVDAWLLDRTSPDRLLHLRARGTTVRLTAYDARDLTSLLLRAECDCEQHRQAGAAGRLVLRPGARPLDAAVYDVAAEAGRTGVAAGLLRADDVAPLLLSLHADLTAGSALEATA
jgi:hypothetical protein